MICYNKYGDWIRKRFGCKVQKSQLMQVFHVLTVTVRLEEAVAYIAIMPLSTPNIVQIQQGRISQEERLNLSADNIRKQLEAGKDFFSRKYPEMKYIAYFQSYTNTYGDIEALKRLYEAALSG